MDESEDVLNGIDREVLNRALKLIRDRYGSAEKSVFFLEINAGVSAINSGIANQRDCFSHLVTLLKNPGLTREQQEKQLGSMEEHLRRAVLEPPLIAVATLWERFEPVHEEYKKTVLTLPGRGSHLPGSPNNDVVEARIKAILKLIEKARAGKGENRWDVQWELAVAEAVEAFKTLSDLKTELEGYVADAHRIRESRVVEQHRQDDRTQDNTQSKSQFRRGVILGGLVSLLGSLLVGWLFYALT